MQSFEIGGGRSPWNMKAIDYADKTRSRLLKTMFDTKWQTSRPNQRHINEIFAISETT